MQPEQLKKRNIAIVILFLNAMLFVPIKTFGPTLPEPLGFLMFLLYVSISITALYFIFRNSSRQKKFMLLLIPATVLLLAFITYLWEHL